MRSPLAGGPHAPRDDVRAAPQALGDCTEGSRVTASGQLQAGTQQGQRCRSLWLCHPTPCQAITQPLRLEWNQPWLKELGWESPLRELCLHGQREGRLISPKSKESSPSCLGSSFFAVNADSAEHQIAVLCFPVKETLNSTNFPRKYNVFPRKSGFFLTKVSPSYTGISELFWHIRNKISYSHRRVRLSMAWVRLWASSLSRYFHILLWRCHHTSLKMHLISLSWEQKLSWS